MISFIAHQWRQPLNAIASTMVRIHTDIYFNKMNRSRLIGLLNEQEERLEYLSQTIETFQEFYVPSKDSCSFELTQSINQVLKLIEARLKENAIIVKLQITSENILIRGKKNEFSQVLLNLISNAQYALLERKIPKPSIHISTSLKKDKIIIEVKDNAGGIEAKPIEKIFTPYFSTRTKQDGTGIGLYISRLIIQEHYQGSLSASNDAQGAIFTISLPISS